MIILVINRNCFFSQFSCWYDIAICIYGNFIFIIKIFYRSITRECPRVYN